jgi:N-acetylglucosamine kinase
MNVFLGVDGGQSSTTALIGDETGRVLGTGVGGPCNHVGAAEGAHKLRSAVGACVAQACQGAGIDPGTVRFQSACFGMSGGPADKQKILAGMLKTELLTVTTDAVIALAGATAGGPGIITIAGTGSIAYGRNAAGHSARAGGWGYIFGDEGGGFDIVRQALRAVLRHEEGWGPETSLRVALLAATAARDANELLHRFYTQDWPRPRIASLARLVDVEAVRGDSVALEILRKAARRLAMLAASVRGQLWDRGAPVLVVPIGGVFQSRIVLEQFRLRVESVAGNQCGKPAHVPAAGALLEAYRAAGLHPQLRELPEFES